LFGQVTEGLDVVAALDAVGSESGTPSTAVTINKVTVTEGPAGESTDTTAASTASTDDTTATSATDDSTATTAKATTTTAAAKTTTTVPATTGS